MRKALLTTFSMVLPLVLAAQSYINIFSLSYTNSPGNTYDSSDAKVTTEDIAANLRIPIKLKNEDVLLFGATSNRLAFYYEDDSVDVNEKFYGVSINAGYQKKWNDKLNTLFMVIPKISSDMKDVSGEDMQVAGLVLFTLKKSDKLKWKFGMYYNTEYFGPFIVPLLGIDWKMTEKMRMFGALPSSMTIEYKPKDKLAAGLLFASPALSYRLSEKRQSLYLQQGFDQIHTYLDYYIAKNVVIKGQVGYSISRRYRLFRKDDPYDATIFSIGIGEERDQVLTPVFNKFSNGLLLNLSFIYRVQVE